MQLPVRVTSPVPSCVYGATNSARESLHHLSLCRARLLGLSWVRFPNSHLHVCIYGKGCLFTAEPRVIEWLCYTRTCLSLPTLEPGGIVKHLTLSFGERGRLQHITVVLRYIHCLLHDAVATYYSSIATHPRPLHTPYPFTDSANGVVGMAVGCLE